MKRAKEFVHGPGKRQMIKSDEVLASLATALGVLLRKHGLEDRAADEIAVSAMDEVRVLFGGQNLYFPKGHAENLTLRDEEIYDRFQRNELSMAQIVEVYGVSMQWAYKVIRAVRAKRRQEREHSRQSAGQDDRAAGSLGGADRDDA